MLVVAGCAAVVSMGFAALSFYKYRQPQETVAQIASPTTPATVTPTVAHSPSRPTVEVTRAPLTSPTPLLENRREAIINEEVMIKAGRYSSYPFAIKNDQRRARAVGNVFAYGGGRDDIVMFIVDDRGLQDFSEGRDTKFYFTSRVQGSQDINVALPPGNYHVILSNRHARFFKKRVSVAMYVKFD
jgi:hypothetical protein